jgi:hypothetical protein
MQSETNKDVNKKVIPGTQILIRRIAPNDQANQLYADPKKFLDDIISFVRDGFKGGETIIVVASSHHLLAIQNELRAEGFDIFFMTLRGQFIQFDAETVLDKFMVNNWPDEVLFKHLILTLASRALKNERNVRVFSEMAAVLYMKGYRAASVQLEHIWNKLVKDDTLYQNVNIISEILPPSPDGDDTTPSFLRKP